MNATNRIFSDVETGEKFRLHVHPETHDFALISDGSEKLAKGCEVNGFFICSHCHIEIKLSTENKPKIVSLNTTQFYNVKFGEKITHKKYAGFKRFIKA